MHPQLKVVTIFLSLLALRGPLSSLRLSVNLLGLVQREHPVGLTKYHRPLWAELSVRSLIVIVGHMEVSSLSQMLCSSPVSDHLRQSHVTLPSGQCWEGEFEMAGPWLTC